MYYTRRIGVLVGDAIYGLNWLSTIYDMIDIWV